MANKVAETKTISENGWRKGSMRPACMHAKGFVPKQRKENLEHH